MALPLRNGSHAGNCAACRVDTNFAGIEHAHTQDVTHLGRARANHFGEGH